MGHGWFPSLGFLVSDPMLLAGPEKIDKERSDLVPLSACGGEHTLFSKCPAQARSHLIIPPGPTIIRKTSDELASQPLVIFES